MELASAFRIFINRVISMAKWLALCLLAFTSTTFAEEPFLHAHEEGWFWHNERIETEKKPEPEVTGEPTISKPADPDKVWKQIGKAVERARAKAILNPTTDNIAEARRLQRLVVAQANVFSEKWMLDLLIHPEHDESLVNPSNSAARDIYNQNVNGLKERAIAAIRATSGLVYFYEAGEPYSERMAEVVRDFAGLHQITVIPIAMTARVSSHFPDSRIDSGQAIQMGVKHIPAVFTIHPVSKQSIPVAYGLVSQTELLDNILLVSRSFQPEVNQ